MVNNQLDILKSNIPVADMLQQLQQEKIQRSDARLRWQRLSREYTDKLVDWYERIKDESISALSGINPYWDKLLITIKTLHPPAICAALVFSGSAGAVPIDCHYATWCSGVAYPDNTGVISGVLVDGKWVPNGIFTVPDDLEFIIDGNLNQMVPSEMVDPSAVLAPGWDGNSLTKRGAGTLTLTGNNLYTGDTFIDAGTLQLGEIQPPYHTEGNFVVANGGELKIIHRGSASYKGVISGAGTVTLAGTGNPVLLTGENTYTGRTTIVAGRELWLGDGRTTGSVKGDIVNNGILVFNRSDDVTYAGVISGRGFVDHMGTGTLTLTGKNTTNFVIIEQGQLWLGDGGTTGSMKGDIQFNHGLLGFNRSDDVTYADVILGAGAVTQAGTGTLTLTGENTYTGGTTIAAGTLRLGDGGTTGSVIGNIDNAAALAFNRSDAATYAGVIFGAGTVTQAGTGTLTLTGENTYTGTTTIAAGTLKTGVADAFAHTSGVTIADGARLNLGGHSQTLSMLNNSGVILFNDLGAPRSLYGVTVTGNMDNRGMLVLNTCANCAGQVFTQDGDWAGNGGSVSFGTVLGDDDSKTDKLIITGAATGTTYVTVTNEGGTGASTVEGIALIQTASSTENAFVQQGRIVAGAYDYRLQQGSASGMNANNWYLTSLIAADEPVPPGDDTVDGGAAGDAAAGDAAVGDTIVLIAADDPVGASTAAADAAAAGDVIAGASTPGGGNRGVVHVYRPEAGSYASNLAAAGTMFNMRLSDRQSGESVDPATGARHRLWARTVSGHGQGRMSDGQNQYTAERSVLQLGGSVLGGSFTGKDAWRLGVMAGYGSQHSKTRNRLSGYSSRGRVGGYGAGLYGGWYQNGQTRAGLYLDGWALYNRFDNTVKGDGLADEQYTSRGITASVESGYLFDAGSYTTGGGRENRFSLRPEAQLLWSGINADDRTERSGTKVRGASGNGVQTRLGARLSMTSSLPSAGQGNARAFETFLEANWLRASRPYGVTLDETRVSIQGSRNVAELKAGVQGYLSERLSVSADVTRQQGGHGYRDTQGTLKVTYRF